MLKLIGILSLYCEFISSVRLRGKARGPKEEAIKQKRDAMVAIINPLEVYSPYLSGYGHEYVHELELKQQNEDANKPSAPFMMRDGDDSAEIFTEVGKMLPLKLLQQMTTMKTKIKYIKKIAKAMVQKVIAKVMVMLINLDSGEV